MSVLKLKIFVFVCTLCAFSNGLEDGLTTTTSIQESTHFTRLGVCPPVVLEEKPECADNNSYCEHDSDCQDDMKCCNQGCGNVCTYPSYTGCQQLRSLLSIQAGRVQETKNIHIPKCTEDGKFEKIQCNEQSGTCWCVNDLGFELAGTRASSYDLVNCSAPRPCADVLCRMLCPYSFQLDSDGCPLCRCRNPCEGVECPAGQECQLEEIPCVDEACPPLPTCKRPRSLEDLCPMGSPLSSPDNGNPFLCGVQPNKPQCPPNYLCDVMPGNDYGVCCPLVDKPGQCPKELHAGETCTRCSGDMDCGGSSKCCIIEGCGLTCTKPANTTLCLQQKAVVELLLSGNDGYEGYIPQCLENGEFSPKQCSANGHLCWCVMENGTIISGTMAPKDDVQCEPKKPEEHYGVPEGRTTAVEESYAFGCDKWECNLKCEAGFKYDGKGCKICECSEPCKDITCPAGLECILVKTDNCFEDDCVPIATCRDVSAHCNWGRALHMNGSVVPCKDNECPDSHFCEMKTEDQGICCPKRFEIEHTKDSECPDHIYEPDVCGFVCHSDSECDGDMKCCQSKACGAICFPPKPPKMPTMCEYIRDAGVTIEAAGGNATLAIPTPQCLPDGPYEPMQCDDNGDCWCVDEFGVEIVNTRTTSPDLNCIKVRDEMPCLGLICRLGCDFGFVMDEEGCPLCHCRNPCQNVSCGPEKTCQFLEVACDDEWCPPLPYCVTEETSARTLPECPAGSPMLYDYDDDPVLCDPFSQYPQCPPTHECTVSSPRDIGVCCPKVTEPDDTVPADETEKKGQCPYLIPIQAETCDYQCSTDNDCSDNKKCCSNGCGTQCVEPIFKTACQHFKSSAEHRAIELGIPASHVFMPNCTYDGEFSPVQCDPVDKTCWCVDKAGSELPGTREVGKTKEDCTPEVDNCTPLYCHLSCPHGYEADKHGCPLCECNDPCKGIMCKNPEESCRLVSVNCVSEPCPPIPLCLPRIENPCPIGEPLKREPFGEIVQCGPHGEQCPSSHRCHLSPLHEYALCCPKPIVSTCETLKKRNQQLRKATNRVTFLPKCNRKTGAWDPTQCMESLGLCWCVDSEGNQLPGTLIRGVPHCTARSGKSLEDTPICPDGAEVHICPEDLCQGKVCLAHPNATCNIDPCGGCKIQFLDDFNEPVDCNHDLTACFAEVQKVINSGVLKTRKFIDEDILPELEEIVEELSFPPPAYPPPPPPPHFLKRREAVYDYDAEADQPAAMYEYDVPAFVEDLSQTQNIAVPKMMVVPQVHTIHIRIEPQVPRQMPRMESRMVPIFEPLFSPPISDLINMHPQVEVVGSAQRYTIMDDGDSSFMVKHGACPAPSLLSILRSISEGCRDQCYSDFDCPGSLKCCLYSCGLSCMPPEIESRAPKPHSKPGDCPPVSAQFVNPFACLFASGMCSSDEECSGSQKCCPTSCGSQCIKIAEKKPKAVRNDSPVYLQAAAPRCSVEGGYAITQKQGELSWCVDQFGNPIHSTLTRGSVECDSNGTIVNRVFKGPVCADPKIIPIVCKDACLMADCPQHPEAICLADPCNNCKVKFVSADGSPVLCQEKCSQPLTVGNCRSALPRYFFNQTSSRCEAFSYGGCEGNDNNFENLESCKQECERKVPRCEQPKEVGLCRAQIFRWFYNRNTHQCEQFVYGGCSGNDNNFETREECEKTCPDLVICPWINIKGEDVTPCSRSSACANATCPGKEDAICTVDPCSCEPSFVSADGKAVNCDLEEEQIPEETTAFLRRSPLSSNTRCQSLLKWHLLIGDTVYIPQCDELGQFYPVQCSRGKTQQCWCVDEAGMQLSGSPSFTKGTKTCKFIKVKKIEVTLAFKHDDTAYVKLMEPAIKRVIEQFLKDLRSESTEVSVNVLPDAVHVMFTLLGDNKVQVAYMLEEMMRMGKVYIVLPKSELPGDYSGSYFYHKLDYSDEGTADNSIASNRISGISASVGDYNWTMFAVFLAVGCLVLFVLFYVVPALLRRRNKEEDLEEKEKPSLISMVVHNVTYGITGKKPKKPEEEDPEEPKVVVQTVEAEYESLQKKKKECDEVSNSSEAPPAYDDVKSKEKADDVEKH